MSLGYGIDIYQESINKLFREYLVNFNYFIQLMEDYGFTLITKDEANHMSLPNNTGLFSEMFTQMDTETTMQPNTKSNYRYAANMTTEEKQISFMNRYFVFKKLRSVDASKLGEIIGKQNDIIDKVGVENIQEPPQQKEQVKPTIKKTKKKIVLKQFSVEQDEPKQTPVVKQPKLRIVGKIE